MDFKTLLASAKLPERTVPVCLRGDLVAEVERLERELEAAQPSPGMLNSGTEGKRIARRIKEIQAEMQGSTHDFILRALPRARWTQLVAEHAPREGNEMDASIGFNMDSFPDALIQESIVDPEMSADEWTQLCKVLTQAQYDKLGGVALELNKRDVSVPFSFAASQILTSDSESRRPEGSESPSNASTAGNRAERRRTRTTKTGD